MKQTFFRPIKGIHGERSGKYFYKVTDTNDTNRKKPHTRKTCPACGKSKMMQVRGKGFCSVSCSQLGPNNTQWNPDTEYVYVKGQRREYKVCKRCGKTALILAVADYCSNSCAAPRGEEHPIWNPDSDYHKYTRAEMTRFHQAVVRARGRAAEHGCSHCGTTEDRVYHWANVSRNYEDVRDYIFPHCVPCHWRYDHPGVAKDDRRG